MKVGSIGYNYSHGKEFLMDRPEGPGCWLFLLVKTPAYFEIDGKKQNVKRNSFVLFSHDTSCKYCAADDIYTDDWFYAGREDGDEEMLSKLNIPINEAVYIGNMEELSQIIHIMTYEHYSADPYHEDVEKRYLEILLMKLSRAINSNYAISSALFKERNSKLTNLRARIYNTPDIISDISGMAAEVGMSRSGFQHLYKKYFGVNVTSDIINSRVEKAKRLLSATRLTVNEIAERCGYSSEYHFMRQFKDKTGKTPTEYRKNL